MSDKYAAHIMKLAMAQICLTVGWESADQPSLDHLTHCAQRFIRNLGCLMARAAELSNRTEPNEEDAAFAFRMFGINLSEMVEYIEFVEPNPLPYDVQHVSIMAPSEKTAIANHELRHPAVENPKKES